MKIYISGPITGTTDYMERFARVEQALIGEGHTVVNPAKVLAELPETTTHAEYMATAIVMLDMCEVIFMMDGWQQSVGCAEEMIHAARKGITITFEGGKGCQRDQNSAERENFLPAPVSRSESGMEENVSFAERITRWKEQHSMHCSLKASCTTYRGRVTVLEYLRMVRSGVSGTMRC